MTESIQQIAKEMRDAAGDFTGWGREILEGFADRLDATAAPVVAGSDIGNPISGDTGNPVSARWPPDVIAWHDDKTVWLTHRAKRSGTHALVYAAAPVVVGEDVYRRALVWLASGDTGSSSEAIVYHMLGLESDADYPFDPADLGRCLRMLELFPEWKPRISEMSAYPHGWPALIPIWNKIAAMMADEVGIDWSKGRRAPRTYAAMRAALTAAMAAD